MDENQISRVVLDSAFEVYRQIGGPGLVEDIYEEALAAEIEMRGLAVVRQVDFPVRYKGRVLSKRFRADMLVGNLVLVENKAVLQWNPLFEAQLLTYLRITGLKLGLAINFGDRVLKNGIHRVVNGL